MDLAIIDATCGSAQDTCDGLNGSRYVMPIANAPLICHVLGEVAQTGIARVRVVAAPGIRADLERALGEGGSAGLQVSYTETPDAERRRTVLAEVERALGAGSVLLHPGDRLFGAQVTTMRDRFRAGDVDSVLAAHASTGGPAPATHPAPADRRVSETALVLGPRTRRLVDELLAPAGETEDLVEVLLHSDCRLAVCELTERWAYGESTQALLAGNRWLLDAIAPAAIDERLTEGNQLDGRIAIGHGAFISNCVIRGPVVIGDRAVLEDSFIGPYTAIGRDAILSGAELDNTMVLAGAEIRHPGQRIEASIIGERAQVTRTFDLPRGIHLRIGAGARVTFS